MENSIEFFKQNNKNKNKTQATKSWIETYRMQAVVNGCPERLEIVENANDLYSILEKFFANVKKRDDKNYEPSSLACMQAALHRHLVENGSHFNILSHVEFNGLKDVIEGRARYLREVFGMMGKKPNRSDSLTTAEEELLWECGQLGDANGRAFNKYNVVFLNAAFWLAWQTGTLYDES